MPRQEVCMPSAGARRFCKPPPPEIRIPRARGTNNPNPGFTMMRKSALPISLLAAGLSLFAGGSLVCPAGKRDGAAPDALHRGSLQQDVRHPGREGHLDVLYRGGIRIRRRLDALQ